MSAESITLTKDQFQQILDALQTPRMNPLEEKRLKDELERAKRLEQVQIESARTEMLKRENKKNGCSHTRYPMSAGKKAGHAAPRGQGEWTTSGQPHADDTATMICERCGYTWRWKTTPQERDYFMNNDGGMLGMAPPEESRVIYQG